MNPDDLLIRILDNNNCSDQTYKVVFEHQVISVSGSQVDTESHPVALYAEAFIRVAAQEENLHKSYSVHASYSDCEAVSSEVRKITSGHILYEFIKGNKITHQVRA